MMGWSYGMSAGGWLLMTVAWVVLVVVAVALVMWIFPRDTRRPSADQSSSRTPRVLLDERLARGEIDVGTYRSLREELTRTVAPRR
jgi:putative membrane protein